MATGYQAMWVMLAFDLPTITNDDKRRANRYRKMLLQNGFTRVQLSVYGHYTVTRERANLLAERMKRFIPANGHVTIFFITDRQFGMTCNLYGSREVPIKQPELALFL